MDQYYSLNLLQKPAKLPNNKIQTSIYTLLNFLPKNLQFQFSKLANVLFLPLMQDLLPRGGRPAVREGHFFFGWRACYVSAPHFYRFCDYD